MSVMIVHMYLTGAQGSSKWKYSTTFPFFLRDPNCNGLEEHLIDCPGSEIQNITSCSYASEVFCAGNYEITIVALRTQSSDVPSLLFTMYKSNIITTSSPFKVSAMMEMCDWKVETGNMKAG